MKISKTYSAWEHIDEWLILPCPKVMTEKTFKGTYLTFEISWLKYTACFSVIFIKKPKNDLTIGI